MSNKEEVFQGTFYDQNIWHAKDDDEDIKSILKKKKVCYLQCLLHIRMWRRERDRGRKEREIERQIFVWEENGSCSRRQNEREAAARSDGCN